MKITCLLSLIAAPVFAECPAGRDHSAVLTSIIEQMQLAPNEGAAQALAGQMWNIWLEAPDAAGQRMLDEGLAHVRYGDYAASRTLMSDLIAYCPNYAEGYNQRAYGAFLSRDFDAALVDLDAAIALQPAHLGALTGKARTLIEMGRTDEAQVVLRIALAINPWLTERALLIGALETDI